MTILIKSDPQTSLYPSSYQLSKHREVIKKSKFTVLRSNNREQRPRRAGQRNPKLRLFVIPSSQNRNLERGRQFDNLGCFLNSTMLSLCVFSSGLYHYYIQKEAEGIPTKLASFPKQDP